MKQQLTIYMSTINDTLLRISTFFLLYFSDCSADIIKK
jgi:hypothetical protein